MPRVRQPARAGCDRLRQVCRPSPCSKRRGLRGGQGSRAGGGREELAAARGQRIRAQVIYSNSNRRQAEQVEAALQEWDLTQNQPDSANQRFSLHQRWSKNFSAKACEGHVLLVEVTKEFFAAHKKAEEKAGRVCSICEVPVPGAYTWLDPATQQPCYGSARSLQGGAPNPARVGLRHERRAQR